VTTPAAAALRDLAATTSGAEADELVALAIAADADGAWDRSSPLHLTASAIVVHPPTARVLLRWHRRQQGWMQVGGHGDPGEDDPLAIALREGAEETGLPDLRPFPDAAAPRMLHAVVVPVAGNDREPAHQHGDLRYLLATDVPDAIEPEDDGAPLRWLTIDEALALTAEENVRETLRRAATQLT
jgi:8-oxo-dGTP pyrophosphatase MutT (NUDIX family)